MKCKKKKPSSLKLVKANPPNLLSRRRALRIVSLGLNVKKRSGLSRQAVFDLCKLWSTKNPPELPSSWKKLPTLVKKEMEKGDDVLGDVNAMLDFHCPLLAKYVSVFDDNVDRVVGWYKFKNDVSSLGPAAWEKCREKIPKEAAASDVGILEFLSRVSRRLRQSCIEDTGLINQLHDISRRDIRRELCDYDAVSTTRRVNVMEMNRCLSLMHLFYFLYEIGRWSGLDVVTDFFKKKIGDRQALESYCQVLDLEALTSRRIHYDDKGTPVRLMYAMDERDICPSQCEEEGERAWWIWVEKCIRDFQSRTECCNLQQLRELYRIVRRIDKGGNVTGKVIEALDESWQIELDCLDFECHLGVVDVQQKGEH